MKNTSQWTQEKRVCEDDKQVRASADLIGLINGVSQQHLQNLFKSTRVSTLKSVISEPLESQDNCKYKTVA